jgi:DNA-binding MarR family transcriptional regulator
LPDNISDRVPSFHNERGQYQPRKSAFGQLKALLFRTRPAAKLAITEDHILSILIARRARVAVFGPNLFSEPAWDALLELYAAQLGRRSLSLDDIAKALDVPQSTMARWVDVLADRDLIETESDTIEPSRLWLRLTAKGQAKMKQLADHWGAAFLSI